MPNPLHPKALTIADLTMERRIVLKPMNPDLRDDRVYVVRSEPALFINTEEYAATTARSLDPEFREMMGLRPCITLAVEGQDQQMVLFLDELGITADTNGNWNGAIVLNAPVAM